MDYEREVNSLSAETMALQNILVRVLSRISEIDERYHLAIKQGFDEAASLTENLAIQVGKAASPDHVVKAISIIESLRTATLGNPDRPRSRV